MFLQKSYPSTKIVSEFTYKWQYCYYCQQTATILHSNLKISNVSVLCSQTYITVLLHMYIYVSICFVLAQGCSDHYFNNKFNLYMFRCFLYNFMSRIYHFVENLKQTGVESNIGCTIIEIHTQTSFRRHKCFLCDAGGHIADYSGNIKVHCLYRVISTSIFDEKVIITSIEGDMFQNPVAYLTL